MMLCPKCNSNRVYRSHRRGIVDRLSCGLNRYPYRCHDCKHRFFLCLQRGSSFPPGVPNTYTGAADGPQVRGRWRMLVFIAVALLVLALLYARRSRRPTPNHQPAPPATAATHMRVNFGGGDDKVRVIR
jgi:hypothetical protein